MEKNNLYYGYTLVEILVVVFVFSILGIVVTGVVSTTLRGSGKSENKIVVRENVSYAMGVLERNLRNAEEIKNCSATKIEYVDNEGVDREFGCEVSGGVGKIYLDDGGGKGYLTNSEISVDCTGVTVFSCPADPIDHVDITLSAIDSTSEGSENALTAVYSESVRIRIRNY